MTPNSPSSESSPANVDRIPMWLRLFLVLLSLALSALLIIAGNLQPNPRGYGTHLQLGFAECTFIVLWGIPCPMCGMTTSWSHLLHADLPSAFQSNPGGGLLGLTSMLAIPICLWRAWTGVPTTNNWLSRFTLLWLCLVLFVIATFWIWQIQYRRPLF